MNIDLALLLKDSLLLGGCSESLLNDFDDNSTIALEFADSPTLYILKQEDGNIVLWSQISEVSESLLANNAFNILNLLLQPVEFAQIGHMTLSESNGYFIIKCSLNERYLQDSEHFLDALAGYVDFLHKLIEQVK